MSVLELVSREVRRAAAAARLALATLPLVVGLALLTGGAMWLARGRWMTLPPVLPFVVWLAAFGLGLTIAVLVRRRLRARSSESAVALAIEDEQQLRRGALTGLLEVASEGGPFVGKASAALGARLAPVAAHPAPRHRRRLRTAAVLSALALAQVLALATTSYATPGTVLSSSSVNTRSRSSNERNARLPSRRKSPSRMSVNGTDVPASRMPVSPYRSVESERIAWSGTTISRFNAAPIRGDQHASLR